ncbi:hypothetical protein HKD37_U058054 (mitochondrion) [Glycine soja]
MPRWRQVRIQTFFPNQSLFISFVVLLAQWSNLEEGSWMFFSIYHHYGPYGQIDVVRIIVCPFEKDECPTHVISAKGFVSERSAGIIEKRKALYVLVLGAPVKVNSLLVFTFGHQESRTDSLALLCKGLTSDVWKYVVEVNSSEMQPEGNLSFDPLFKIFRIVTAPFIAIRETALFPQDGPSCFCLMETRVQVQTFRNQDMAGAGFEPAIFSLLTRVGSEILRDPITYEKVSEFISPLRERGDFVVIANEQLFRLVRDRFTPRGAYTSRLSKFCSKTSSENLYREGFPAAQQFFHTNLAARRCYWHNNRYTIGWPNPVLSY